MVLTPQKNFCMNRVVRESCRGIEAFQILLQQRCSKLAKKLWTNTRTTVYSLILKFQFLCLRNRRWASRKEFLRHSNSISANDLDALWCSFGLLSWQQGSHLYRKIRQLWLNLPAFEPFMNLKASLQQGTLCAKDSWSLFVHAEQRTFHRFSSRQIGGIFASFGHSLMAKHLY